MGGGRGLPSGIVTLLLTDVVGSTRGWQRSADAMDGALQRQTGLIEAAVNAHGGTMLKHRGEGDSTFSVFSRASDAVRAALDAQRALVAEPWPSGGRLSVRFALHSGEAIERDADYFGPTVNRAARLRALGSGGDILLSGTTADLIADDLPAQARLIDHGARQLRDLDRAERVFGLLAEGIRASVVDADAPTATSLEAHGVSAREAEVLAAVGERLSNAEIGSRLYVSARTVETHIASLLRKLGAANRRELAELWKRSTTGEPVQAERRPPALPSMLELLADASTFVGRRSEREVLRRRWEVARDGHTVLVLVTGEAGMGKSRLVAELAAEVHRDGGRVLLGNCYEDADQPYGPFAQAISGQADDLSRAEVRRRVLECGTVLARLSPELSRAVPDDDARRAGGDVEVSERAVMLDAVVGWLVATASSGPTLLVVEDLHWSSPTTRDVMRHLVRTAGRPPLLVVATARDRAPDLDDDLNILLGDLERSPAVTRIVLHGLDRDDVAALARVSGADADAIIADTAGNPLLVTHMTAGVLDNSLDALLSRREEHLDLVTRGVLDLAATLGSEFEAELLAAGSGAPLLSVLDALEVAEAAGWVAPLPGRPGRFGFVHALFRSHRYHALALRRRLELHAQAAVAWAARAVAPQARSEQARHACLAVPVGDARLAVELSREAGREAEHAYAFDEAAAHYRRGLEAARALDPPDHRSTLELTVRLGAALHALGDRQGLSMLLDAAQRAREAGDDSVLVEAAMSFSTFGGSRVGGQVVSEIVAVIDDALAVLGGQPSAARARLLIEKADAITYVRIDEQLELTRAAEAMARQLGDDDALAHVLLWARHLTLHPSRQEDYERVGLELERLGRRLPSRFVQLAGVVAQSLAILQRGDLDRWRRECDRYEALVGSHGLPFFQLDVQLHWAQHAFLDGDLDRAEQVALEMASLARRTGRNATIWTGAILLLNRRLQCKDAELRVGIEHLAAHGVDVATWQCVLAAIEARAGSIDDARRTLARLRADSFAIPEGPSWSLAMTELAEAAEVASEPETARHVLAECSRYSGRIAAAGTCINRPFDQALAQAALAADDIPLAEAYASRAVAASRERRTPIYLCRDLVFLAAAKRRHGAPREELEPLIEEAITIAERTGAEVVLVDLDRHQLAH